MTVQGSKIQRGDSNEYKNRGWKSISKPRTSRPPAVVVFISAEGSPQPVTEGLEQAVEAGASTTRARGILGPFPPAPALVSLFPTGYASERAPHEPLILSFFRMVSRTFRRPKFMDYQSVKHFGVKLVKSMSTEIILAVCQRHRPVVSHSTYMARSDNSQYPHLSHTWNANRNFRSRTGRSTT